MAHVITLKEYFGDKVDLYPNDYNEQIVHNAAELIDRVNQLLDRLSGVYFEFQGINSGWRPKSYNDKVPNASKTSKHISAEAIDLTDSDGVLADLLYTHQGDLLVHFNLYMEHPSATNGWCHLQTPAPHSGNRVFYP